jgi:uncharacterized iron-regulated membrane protein
MTDMTVGRAQDDMAARTASDLYRAVWRWHFYAGLLVLPFLISLAITGSLYLFHTEIDAIVHSDLKQVEVQPGQRLPASTLVAAAVAAHPGTAVKFTDPATATTSAEITVTTASGERLAVYVDPYSGKVLGSLPDRGTIMWTIRTLHSLKYFGSVARMAIEIAAGWAILLVGTGIYLWWPRQQTGGVVSVRGTPKRRIFWRDTHAVTGIFVGGFIVFLALTGMPWSGVWGSKVNEWANGGNFGYPSGMWVDVPMSGEHLNHMTHTAWSLEQAQVPQSASGMEGMQPISLDQAIAVFDRLGLHRGYAADIPSDPSGVYTGSVFPEDVAGQRVVHLDQYSGEPLIDVGYGNYGPVAKTLEWGINVHMGQQFGLANKLVLLAACIAVVVLAISAGVMWWKRRPSGSLGVPPLPQDQRVFRGLLAILAIGGIIFPLVGASLLVMLALDWLLIRTRRARTA